MKVTFLGSGAWATALAYALCKNEGHDIILYGNSPAEINDVNTTHINSRYFPDVVLPNAIRASLDPAEALRDRDVLVLAVPSKAINDIVDLVAQHCTNKPLLVNVIKGFDPLTGDGITSLIRRSLKGKVEVEAIVSLVGPSFAYDVIHDDLTAIDAVCEDKAAARKVQHMFSSSALRVYVQADVVGAEVGAGMKNIIAIASGIMEGLGYKDNTRAAIITRGLAEMTRFGLQRGAKRSTFLGLTGVGDLTLTASSLRSRNFALGVDIGKANDAESVLRANEKTVEGVIAAKTIHFEAHRVGVETPIVDAVYAILYENRKPSDVVARLMQRELKEE